MIAKMYIELYVDDQGQEKLLKDTAFSINEKGLGILASESNIKLWQIKDKFDLVLVNKNCYGPPETYVENEVLGKVLDCRVLNKNITNSKIEIQFKGNLTWKEL